MGKKCCNSYSIWMSPKGPTYLKLADIIGKLSREYKTPFFIPHITLIRGLKEDENSLISKCESLASKIKPFIIELAYPDFANSEYQSVFLRPNKTPGLMEARKKAEEIFSKKDSYFPHLSLAYGNFTTDDKIKMISKINASDIEFEVEELSLLLTKGSPENWREINRFPIKS